MVSSRLYPKDKRERLCELTPDARELLQVALEVSVVEAGASPTLRNSDSPSLMNALADEYARMIPPAMLDKEQTHTQLRTSLPTISETAFDKHLSLLVDCGLVRKRPGSRSKEHTYELTELAPALVRPLARAARLRIRMTPHDAPPQTGDVPSYIELLELGGALRAPREARGVVELHVIPREGEHGWRDVEVALENGHISLRRNGNHPLRATVRATPLAWWNAILDEDLYGIEIEDDVELAHTLLAAISAAGQRISTRPNRRPRLPAAPFHARAGQGSVFQAVAAEVVEQPKATRLALSEVLGSPPRHPRADQPARGFSPTSSPTSR